MSFLCQPVFTTSSGTGEKVVTAGTDMERVIPQVPGPGSISRGGGMHDQGVDIWSVVYFQIRVMGVSKGVDEPFNYAFPVSISPRGAPIEGG